MLYQQHDIILDRWSCAATYDALGFGIGTSEVEQVLGAHAGMLQAKPMGPERGTSINPKASAAGAPILPDSS